MLGYNFYANVINLDKATPQNETLITDPEYEFKWDEELLDEVNNTRDFYIEAVYDLGKVKQKFVAEFEVEATPMAESIAEFKAFENGTRAILGLKDAKITVHEVTTNSDDDTVADIVIEDASGAIKITANLYDRLKGYFGEGNVVLNGALFGTLVQSGRTASVDVSLKSEQSVIIVMETEVVPTEMTVTEAATEANLYRFVSFKDASMQFDDLNMTYIIKQGDASIKINDTYKLLPCDDNGQVIVYEIVEYINGVIVPVGDEFAIMPYGDSVLSGKENGILGINAEESSYNVYSVDGVLVRKAGESVSDLSKGIYVINGKKFVVVK